MTLPDRKSIFLDRETYRTQQESCAPKVSGQVRMNNMLESLRILSQTALQPCMLTSQCPVRRVVLGLPGHDQGIWKADKKGHGNEDVGGQQSAAGTTHGMNLLKEEAMTTFKFDLL
jgi:hypothetical protein